MFTCDKCKGSALTEELHGCFTAWARTWDDTAKEWRDWQWAGGLKGRERPWR